MKPLENIKIVELSTMITASFAAMMMAEQGAEVIKVEPIEMGDPMRYMGTSKGGISALFSNFNRGKQSLRVDLKKEEGQKIIQQLSAEADVLIHNFRPGVMDRLNLGSDALRAANPKLIYAAISGFGTEGPMASAPAYDPVVQAQTGFTALQGEGEPPTFIRSLVCDKVTAYTTCQGVTAALLQRANTGAGQHLDVCMLDASLFFLWPDCFTDHTLLDEDRQLGLHVREFYNLSPTMDGAITISNATDKQTRGVFRAIGREDLCEDERFRTLPDRIANLEALQEIMNKRFAEMKTDDLIARLSEQDVPCAKCLDFQEVIDHPQLGANETIELGEHPHMGKMNLLKSPVKFAGNRLPLSRHSPAHGEHTKEVLLSMGYSDADITNLTSDGVVL